MRQVHLHMALTNSYMILPMQSEVKEDYLIVFGERRVGQHDRGGHKAK